MTIIITTTKLALFEKGFLFHLRKRVTIFAGSRITRRVNVVYTILGVISLGLGVLGAFLPVLPTTPLLLLAAALFLRGNKRLYDWLMNHPKLGPYISNFLKHKSIPRRVKIVSIAALWITLINCAIFVSDHWALRGMFLAIAVGVTIHILSYKTLK